MYKKFNSYNNRSNRPNYGRSSQPQQRRKSQLMGADINLFIRKAIPTIEQIEEIEHKSFAEFKLADALKRNIEYHGYTSPTPIQSQAIQPILDGRDVIGLASTGTGKTAAFLIPLIHKMFTNRDEKTLVIVPTRELGLQIQEEFKSFSFGMHLFSTLIIGGTNTNRQIHELRRYPSLVVATPGRLRDLIKQRAINLLDYSNIVLDEVDLMVDIGFINDVKYFISLMSSKRQSLFFSATISPKIQTILHSFLKNPVTISIKKQATSENVDQDVIRVINPAKKVDQLHDLLISEGVDKVLIFGRTKHGMDKLHKDLLYRGFKLGVIHGNKSQGQRQRTLQSFKENEIKILLATDVASRGLDIDNVTHVINYELPETYEDYIHRIGRTGRAGKSGIALTFI